MTNTGQTGRPKGSRNSHEVAVAAGKKTRATRKLHHNRGAKEAMASSGAVDEDFSSDSSGHRVMPQYDKFGGGWSNEW